MRNKFKSLRMYGFGLITAATIAFMSELVGQRKDTITILFHEFEVRSFA